LADEKEKLEKQKSDEFTMAQQLLVLHYLGFINSIDITTKAKSTLLSKILNRSFDNIKKQIPYLNSPKISHSEIKNIVNLEIVWKLFDDLKMYEVADKVKVDLSKIKVI
jgi:hypothetical protein